jgi:hypothetical protein
LNFFKEIPKNFVFGHAGLKAGKTIVLITKEISRLVVAALNSCTNAIFEKSESKKKDFFANQ